MKTVFASLGLLGLVSLCVWGLVANDLALTAYFAPRYERVRRETFEQSKAYRQGMVQELQNMQFSYAQADADGKAALADLILHRAADFPH